MADTDMPPFVANMAGTHSQVVPWWWQHLPDETDPKLKLMWEQNCTDDLVFYADGDHKGESVADAGYVGGFQHKVECRIPEGEWKDKWDSIAETIRNGASANPHKFISNPIEWTRFELSDLIQNSVHWWLEVDDPFDEHGKFGPYVTDHGNPAEGPDTWRIQDNLTQSTLFLVGVVAVISMLFVAGRMALRRDAQPARDMVRAIVTLVIVTAVGFTFITVLLRAGDKFSRYFVVKSLAGHSTVVEGNSDNYPCDVLADKIKSIPAQFVDMNFFLFLLCAIFLLVGSLVLYIYMLARVFVITLLTGLMPLAAASTATQSGKEWFGKQVSYLMAFILIKPAATVVFVVSLRLSSGSSADDSAIEQLTSVLFLFLGTVLLPAMTRLAFPFTSAAAQGEKGAAALATAPVAMGAKVVKSGISSLRR
ncbi:hypothetical protein LO772_18805 [Yinghuangia sp. ASG 101]|uniref:hypothetical protein n=1 Tax=Yinghuangia sp. ASG 101 TaxID=2896848 RepID=UPI001E3374B4|nr:hypothetical protein [Yinghuangia sp. ASG 101]UGQ09021.1 hypothetical protein LO772_18805 [Yinghuangia sp. ASG 101]